MSELAPVLNENVVHPAFDIDSIIRIDDLPIDKGSVSAKAPDSGKTEYTRVHYEDLRTALANLKSLYKLNPPGTKLRVNFVLTIS